MLGEKVKRAKWVGEDGGEGLEVGIILVGDEDLEVWGAAEFLEELAAVAARSGGDGEVRGGGGVEGEVSEEELFGVDGVVEGEVGELDVDAEEDTAVGS